MADDLPAVLALLHESGKRWTTLRAEGEEWVDEEGTSEAFLRRMPPGAVVTSRGAPGPRERVHDWRLWVRQPQEFRAEYGGAHGTRTVVVGDAGRLSIATSGPLSTSRISDRQGNTPPLLGPPEPLVRPLLLPTTLDLEVIGRATFLGRDVIVVRGRPRLDPGVRTRFVTRGAEEMEFGLDAERGVLLWLEARIGGDAFWRATMTTVAFDEDLDDALFAIPETEDEPGPPGPPPHLHHHDRLPERVLGAPVGGPVVVVREPSLVVAVDRVTAYPEGFELHVTVRTRGPADDRRSWSGSAAFPGESPRVDVVAPGAVRVVPVGGSGTRARFDQRYWVAPLPPPGPVGVVVEWPRRGVPETRADLDGAAIVEAAARAERLWS